jgi:large subunit ribosomal protein L4
MPNISVLDMKGGVVGEMTLADRVFAAPINQPVLHQAVVAYLANQRQGNQSTLTRAEVSGGGAKPWRQKGTGRARQGSIRAPHFTHGGVVFAPKPRSYRVSMNKKMKAIAMKSAFSSKVAAGEMKVIDKVELENIKTKSVVAFLSAIGAAGKTLIVSPEVNPELMLSARNIPGVKTTVVNNLNVYDILKYDNFVVLKDAVSKIEEVYA